jgi:ABC-type phosphate transport system substrate-binding protein
MLKGLLRTRALKLGASLVGASVLAVGFASPAFATQSSGGNTQSKNYNIVSGGSNTTYLMMTSLSNLFNESPGCDLASASGTPQPLDYGCPGVNGEVGTTQSGLAPFVGENGFVPFATENPFNDVLIQEPALGSSNGILALEDQNGHNTTTTPVSPLDVARSSRAPKTSDLQGMNFVAYAMDGVSWFHWTKVGAVATPSSTIKTLTVAQLTSIWNGTLTCTVSGKVLPMNWKCLGGQNAPIAVYMAQNGSGTESTWATLLGLTGTFPFGGENAAHVIFENETESITQNADEKNAIFFFSFGKFKTTCQATKGYCGAKPAGFAGGTIALGEIAGITVNAASIAAQLPGATGTVFPGDRLLYNVYADGENPQILASSNAALNAVSEDGFLCKPATKTDLDPNTGTAYLTEIDSIITAQGFFPLPLMVEDGQGSTTYPYSTTASGIPTPAWNELGAPTSPYLNTVEAAAPYSFPAADTDTDNSAVSGSYTGVLGQSGTVTATPSHPVGYCLTVTTDGNANQ